MVERIDAAAHRHVGAAFEAVDGEAIRVHRERCAKVRNRNVECLKCAVACTSGCIALVDGELVLDAARCVGCGTCATVCPTCALEALNPSDAELKASCLAAAATLYDAVSSEDATHPDDAARLDTAACSDAAGCPVGADFSPPVPTAEDFAAGKGRLKPSPTEGDRMGEGQLKPPPTEAMREVVIACSPMEAALDGMLAPGACASVVCAGRVDESLLTALAAEGVSRVTVLCGRCDRCAQRHGHDTAELVAETARALLGAWGSSMNIVVTDEVPEGALADEVSAETARAACDGFFAEKRACPPIREASTPVLRAPTPHAPVPHASTPHDSLPNNSAPTPSVEAAFSPPCAPIPNGPSRGADAIASGASQASASLSSPEAEAADVTAGPGMRFYWNSGRNRKVAAHSLHVMRDGTLPHFVPDRRERLLDALAALGEPASPSVACRLVGAVVIDATRCDSCRMCATFCPTGAIRKFDEADGTVGVEHAPSDCVKCRSCKDVCRNDAITVIDAVPTRWLLGGETHRYTMTPRAVTLTNNPHQILDTFRQTFNGDIFER